MKKKRKRRSSKGKKVSLPNDVAPTTHCDDDNCYTIGAIHTINDESDYDYDMKRPKLGDAMFDEDDIFCPQVLMNKFIMMIACHLPMMIILMKVGLEECQL